MIGSKKVGISIGPKGSIIKDICMERWDKIDVLDLSKETSPLNTNIKSTVTVSAPTNVLCISMAYVQEFPNKGYTVVIEKGVFTDSAIMVHPHYLLGILDPKGMIIRSLQGKLGVKLITYPPPHPTLPH